MDELTCWYGWPVFPVRRGWYDYAFAGLDTLYTGTRLYWDGWQFGYWLGPGPSNWVHWAGTEGDRWRGLAAPP